MCNQFWTERKVNCEGNFITEEYPILKRLIETNFSGMNCYHIAGELQEQLIQNPLNTRLQKCWQCYISHKVYLVVKQIYFQLSGYVSSYSLETLYLMTFNQAFLQFITSNNPQFPIPTQNSIRFNFSNVVTNEISRSICFSNLGLVIRSSRTNWLNVASNSEEKQQFELLYECVAEFRSSIDNLPCNEWTEEEHFSEITRLYNLRRGILPVIENIKLLLDRIGGLIRNLNNTTSLDISLSEEDSITLIEILPSPDLPIIEIVENDLAKEELFKNIERVLVGLSQRHKNIAFLTALLDYKQKPLANLIEIDTATVSHTLKSILRKLIRLVSGETITINSEMLKHFREILRNFYLLKTQKLLQEFSLKTPERITLKIMDEFQFNLNNEQKNRQIQNEIVLLLKEF